MVSDHLPNQNHIPASQIFVMITSDASQKTWAPNGNEIKPRLPRAIEPGTWNLKPETWNLKPETRTLNPVPWTLNPETLKPENWNLKTETWNLKPETTGP